MSITSENYNNLIEFTNQYMKKLSSNTKTLNNITLGLSDINKQDLTSVQEKYQIHKADILETRGYMIICNNKDQDNTTNISIIANSERAVRRLLLSIPHNTELKIFFYEKWIIKIIEEYIYITEHITEDAVFGIKRTYQNITKDKKVLSYEDEYRKITNIQSHNILITSKKDTIATEFKDLNTLKNRVENNKYIIEGTRLVKRALQEGQTIERILYTTESQKDEEILSIIKLAKEYNIPCYLLTTGLMGWVTDTRPIPSIIASVHISIRDVNTMYMGSSTTLLILDSVSNPDNLGMIIRTADASGIDAIVQIGSTTHYLNKNVIRGARGAISRIPIFTCSNEDDFFNQLLSKNFQILGMSSQADNEKLYTTTFKPNIAFIVGNETTGMRKNIIDKCTDNIRIPMAPGQSSLNVGIAVGIILYEYVRRKFT